MFRHIHINKEQFAVTVKYDSSVPCENQEFLSIPGPGLLVVAQ